MTTISDKDRAEVQAMFGGGTPVALSDNAVLWWLAVRDHVIATHEHPPVWRPVSFEEIQPGWEVRVRNVNGEPLGWGTAHERVSAGAWCNPDGNIIGYDGWIWETTAPQPEPWPDELVEDVAGAIDHYDGFSYDELARSLLNLLAERGLIERPKAGEQS